ncbi:MAG: serine/threonine-protein kinase [Coleofasciculus sp. C2-GNP5-27]
MGNPDVKRRGYRIVKELGHNWASGRITYLAERIETQLLVVIKQFQFATIQSNWSDYKSVQQEIEWLRQLNHPSIPRYLESFETSNGCCLVQEYKNALSLAHYHHLTLLEIKQIALGVLDVLVYLQQQNPPLIHRDIKPENILVSRQGSLKIYLVDFGFARTESETMTVSSMVKGTLGFMPPEQVFNCQLTAASDLYSLGATLICLLTETKSAEIGNLIDESFHFNFKSHISKLNPQFVGWLSKMVAPNLNDRFDNAAVALEALKPIDIANRVTVWQQFGNLVTSKQGIPVVMIAIIGLWVLPMLLTKENTVKLADSNNSSVESNSGVKPIYTPSNESVPFYIFSENNGLFDTKFEGSYSVSPTVIEITLTKTTIIRRETRYQGKNLVTAISVGLASDSPNGWKGINHQSHEMNRVMKVDDAYSFANYHPIRFSIPRPNDLSKYWLVFDIQSVNVDSSNPKLIHNYTYSQQDIFSPVANIPIPVNPTDTTLNPPKPIHPLNGTVINSYPRTTTLSWTRVSGANSYRVEIDVYYHQARTWCSERKPNNCGTYKLEEVKTTSFTYTEGGAGLRRWRVWAIDANGREGLKSEWQEFRHGR